MYLEHFVGVIISSCSSLVNSSIKFVTILDTCELEAVPSTGSLALGVLGSLFWKI
jgi:hypothetical protein